MHLFTKQLLSLKDEKYCEFSKKLVPDTKKEIIGVRAPLIKRLIKENNDFTLISNFFQEKHVFHEEFLLHGLLIATIKDVNQALSLLSEFVNQIDNWAVCDSTVSALKIFKKYPKQALDFAKKSILSPNPYVVRFGVVILLDYFLDDNFSNEIITLVKNISSEHYYVNMAIAWFFSVALVKQYDTALSVILEKNLPKFVNNKSIQKAIESFRIDKDKKEYLRKLKV